MNELLIDRASHSEVEAFLMCERRHYYSYGEKLRGKQVGDALVRGIVGHEALAAYYTARMNGASHDDAVRAAAAVIGPTLDQYDVFDPIKMRMDLSVLLSDYFKIYKDDDMEILAVEQKYDVPLTEDFTLPVVIDLIARIPGRGVVTIDHKFTYDFFDVDKLDLSPQLPKYYAALQGLGIQVDGIMYNELRTRETRTNKVNVEEKFRRTPVGAQSRKVVTIMREQLLAARRIGQLKAMPLDEWESRILRNPQACKMCPFTTLCSADMNGEDGDLVRVAYYEKRVR